VPKANNNNNNSHQCNSVEAGLGDDEGDELVDTEASPLRQPVTRESAKVAGCGAKKKLEMDDALGERGNLTPPPPLRNVTLSKKKKMKKAD
jgi:hypothetical protein